MNNLPLAYLPTSLRLLHGRYLIAHVADKEAARRYTRAEASTRRARRDYRAGRIPLAVLCRIEAIQDRAWEAWAQTDAAAASAKWIWEHSFSDYSRCQSAGLTYSIAPIASVNPLQEDQYGH